MSILAKTYYCGDAGGVRKLVNLTGPWIDVSLPAHGIPGASQSTLFDIEVDPNNGDKVFAVGEGRCVSQAFNWFGVAVSSDGGVTWQVPGGNYQNLVNNGLCYYKWNEISIVNSNVSYICGIVDTGTKSGIVAKSIDGGLTYNLCSPMPPALENLNCNSLHFITPLIGVVGLDNYVVKTTNGGSTWSIMNLGQPLSTSTPAPGTLLPIGAITGIYIADDQSYITGIGADFIIETEQVIFPNPVFTAGMGADSWKKNLITNSTGFSGQPLGYHLSYLKKDATSPYKDIISYTGYSKLGVFTYDHGSSFVVIPAPGYDSSGLGFSRIAAHFYKSSFFTQPSGFYSKNGDIYANPTGFDPNVETFSETSPFGVNAIWTWYEETPDTPPIYTLTGCDGTILNTSTNLSAQVTSGVYFTIQGYSECFTASLCQPPCASPISVTLTGTIFQSCQECSPVCFLLTDCSGLLPNIVTDTQIGNYVGQTVTLSDYPGVCWQVTDSSDCVGKITLTGTVTGSFPNCITCSQPPQSCYSLTDCFSQFPTIITDTDVSQYIGSTVVLDTYPGICWQVAQALDCTGVTPLLGTVTTVFVDCESCLQKCYKLTDCIGVAPEIITDADLSLNIGKVIKIITQPNVCYLVTLAETCDNSQSISIVGEFDTCEICMALPIIPEVPLKTRKVQPGYGTGLCSPDYVEKINCEFASQVYTRLIRKKYGVEQCIEDNFDKYLIKKAILDFNLIKDSKACESIICCPIVLNSVITTTVELQDNFTVDNVTATITLVPPFYGPPTNVTATINMN